MMDDFLSVIRGGRRSPIHYDPPGWDSLASPRGTVPAFIEAMNHVELGRTNARPRALKVLGNPNLQKTELQTGARRRDRSRREVQDLRSNFIRCKYSTVNHH